jgi:type I restriction-modification system DNA methylase subunit
MVKKYACNDCGKTFKQKSHYDAHCNKKIPCVLKNKSIKEAIKEAVTNEVSKMIKKDDKNIIIKLNSSEDKKKPKKTISSKQNKSRKSNRVIDYSYLRFVNDPKKKENILTFNKNDDKLQSKKYILKMIDKGHNILYNAENIEGEDALNDIMNFMFIRSIQPIISDKKEPGKIDLLDKKYYNHLYNDDALVEIFSYFENLENLAKKEISVIRDKNEDTDAIRQMGDILTLHPITKEIYTVSEFIKAKKSSTIQLLLNEVINKIDMDKLEENEDVIGEIYEHIINGYVKKGSKLGQFFTPRKCMNLLVQYKEDRIFKKIKNMKKKQKIKLYDSCMGTAGWLVTGYNMLKKKYGDRLLLSGGEVKSTTFQYGLMNLILTLKQFPHRVYCESSLTHINKLKHNFILTNPPFKTSISFNQIKVNFKTDKFTLRNDIKLDDIYNLKSNSPPIQFLELALYKLEDNGMCVIILPYGDLFFGPSKAKNRAHFMKETNITDIILFPSVFTHTQIKTCGLIFEKDKNGTKSINFLKANKKCDRLTKITTVTIDDINKEPNNSWYHRDYLKDKYIEELLSKVPNFESVKFSEIFTLEKGKKESMKIEDCNDGKYPVISKCQNYKNWKYTNDFEIDGENVFVFLTSNTTVFGVTYYDGKCLCTNLVSRLIINSKFESKINIKYIYYYLKSIKNHIENIYLKGACHQSLDQWNLNRMRIPIPLLEEQNKIIINIQALETDTILVKKVLAGVTMRRKMYMESMIKNATNKGINKIIRLGEIIEVLPNGKRKSSEGSDSGKYPLFYCSINNILYMDEYDFEGEAITMNVTNGSGKCNIFHPKGKYSLAESTLHFKSKNEQIIKTNILYNYLILIKESISELYKGTQQMSIRLDDLQRRIKIPIPPLEYQQEIEKTLNQFDNFEELWNNLIEENENSIKDAFMNSFDDYGNPYCFNLNNMIDDDVNEQISIPLKKKKFVKKAKKKAKKKQKIINKEV